MLLKTLN